MDNNTPALNADGTLKEAHKIEWFGSPSDENRHASIALHANPPSPTPCTSPTTDGGQFFLYNPQQGTFNQASNTGHSSQGKFIALTTNNVADYSASARHSRSET